MTNIGGPEPIPLEAGDVNGDRIINNGDVVYLINYLFVGGPPPGDVPKLSLSLDMNLNMCTFLHTL
jgi:hypothetical protein